MTLSERIAWVHKEATSLPIEPKDLVELKHCLKNLISDATDALDCVRSELQAQRTARENHVRQNA